MAEFSANIDVDSILPKALQDENLALEMIKSAQEILKSAIQSGANKHKRTGAMAGSIKAGKPCINGQGDAVGKVNITGKDKTGMSNAQKALWIEYGTKNYPAQPFVRPAVKSSESAMASAMQAIFDKKVKS